MNNEQINKAAKSIAEYIQELEQENARLSKLLIAAWQPMETAPKERKILLDISYWYPGDQTITACFVVANWNSIFEMWDVDEGLRRTDQIHAWMNIPASTLPMPQPEGEE
jgi:hypothetical protein